MYGKMCFPLQCNYRLYDLGETCQPLEFIRMFGNCASHCSESIYVWEDVLPTAVWEYRLYDLGEAGQPLEFIRVLGKCASHCSESIYVWEE